MMSAIPAMIVLVRGSLKITRPRIAVRATPVAAQTPYAPPIGSPSASAPARRENAIA